MKNLVLMCCGCFRLMDVNGKPAGRKCTEGGVIPYEKIAEFFADAHLPELWTFGDKAEADKIALSHGWECVDASGLANHRCPDCQSPRVAEERQGAYVDVAMILAAMEKRRMNSLKELKK